MGSAFTPRYTELLKAIELSNLLYIYSPSDPAANGLEADEIQFLESKSAKIIVTSARNHTAAIKDSYVQNKILKFIHTGNI